MDAKESQLIDYYHQRIVNDAFDEKDVYVLLILLRRHSKMKSAVYEFSNFVAHREKDRGFIHEYVLDKKRIFDRLGSINAKIVIKNIFTLEQIEASFNEVLMKIGKTSFQRDTVSDIVLCIIVLLQDVKLVDKKNRPLGSLVIGVNKDEISLLGRVSVVNGNGKSTSIIFPALEVPNKYTRTFDHVTDTVASLKVVAEVQRIEGELTLEYLPDRKIEK